jgi:DNA-3-methyladenine glycosylase
MPRPGKRSIEAAGLLPQGAGNDTALSPQRAALLTAEFLGRPVLQVTRRLLGCLLIRRYQGQLLGGRIVELEAYGGRTDPAAHSFRGPTPRCQTMFGPVGHAYVYFTYGSHYCVNVVAGSRRDACAVLVRGIEPLFGLESLRELRTARMKPGKLRDRLRQGLADQELCNGPGKLTAALAIERECDGTRLLQRDQLWLAQGKPPQRARWTQRIGLGDNPAAGWFWRCFDPSSTCVTRIPGHWKRAARPCKG